MPNSGVKYVKITKQINSIIKINIAILLLHLRFYLRKKLLLLAVNLENIVFIM